MDDKEFLIKRRQRAIATFLGLKERVADPYLPEDIANLLRKEFLDQINGLCDIALDLISSDNALNEEFFVRLDEIRDIVTQNGRYDTDGLVSYAEIRDS